MTRGRSSVRPAKAARGLLSRDSAAARMADRTGPRAWAQAVRSLRLAPCTDQGASAAGRRNTVAAEKAAGPPASGRASPEPIAETAAGPRIRPVGASSRPLSGCGGRASPLRSAGRGGGVTARIGHAPRIMRAPPATGQASGCGSGPRPRPRGRAPPLVVGTEARRPRLGGC